MTGPKVDSDIEIAAAVAAGARDEKNLEDQIHHIEVKDMVVPAVGHSATQDDSLEVNKKWAIIRLEAERAEALEHGMTVWQSLKHYRASVGWAAAISMCIVMEGYDTALLGGFYALPSFQAKYGKYFPELDEYQVEAKWQVALGQGSNIGNFFGIILGAFLVDRWGYRKSVMVNMALMIPFIALVTFAPNKVALLMGEVLCGFPWGVFSTLAEAYASEVCPLTLRGYLTTYVNLCWLMGQFIASGVLVGVSNWNSQWAYRIPFAVQWAWPPPLLVLLYLAPESPWWLTRKGRLEEAEHSVRRLAPDSTKENAREQVANMIRTVQLEVDSTKGSSYIDCFRGPDRRRTEISTIVWTCPILSGLAFAGGSTYFFTQAGLKTSDAFKMSLGVTGGGFCGTVGSWLLITKFGRRPLFVGGLFFLGSLLLLIGIVGVIADRGNSGAKWGIAVLMLFWTFFYDFTVGPLSYCIVGEVSSTSLRNKTVGMSRNLYIVVSIIAGILNPYMINPTQWNWRGKTGFFWAPIALGSGVWAYYRVPEFKGRSYYELDMLFYNKIPARKFASTDVSTLSESEHWSNVRARANEQSVPSGVVPSLGIFRDCEEREATPQRGGGVYQL